MSTLTPLRSNSSNPADLALQVAKVSTTFQRLFHQRWTQAGSDPRTLAVWERAFQVARLMPEDVIRGLAKAAMLDWPPSAGEFIRLCRPPAPDLAVALAEAGRWARDVAGHDGQWSHPAVGAAAKAVGDFRLRNMGDRELARLFGDHLATMLERHNRGEELSQPVVQRIEDQAKRAVVLTDVDRARQRPMIDAIAQQLGLGSSR